MDLLVRLYEEGIESHSLDYKDISSKLNRTVPAVKDKIKRMNYGK